MICLLSSTEEDFIDTGSTKMLGIRLKVIPPQVPRLRSQQRREREEETNDGRRLSCFAFSLSIVHSLLCQKNDAAHQSVVSHLANRKSIGKTGPPHAAGNNLSMRNETADFAATSVAFRLSSFFLPEEEKGSD